MGEPKAYNLVLANSVTLGEDWESVIDQLVEWAKVHHGLVYVHVPTVALAHAMTSLEDRHLWVEFIIPADIQVQLSNRERSGLIPSQPASPHSSSPE
jgi:hypothetical protein